MIAKIIWGVSGTITRTAFRVGMWFARLSEYGLTRSHTASGSSWHVSHWSQEKGKLVGECRVEEAGKLRTFLWYLAEPHPEHAGSIPAHQYQLLIALVVGTWHGGRTPAVLELLAEVMLAEDLIVY